MLPYQGNKSVIAKDICLWLKYKFPHKTNFYDLFGGGGSISYEAIKHFKNVHYNEYLEHIYLAVKCVLEGKQFEVLPKNRWISRDAFFEIKNSEPSALKGLVLTCWSFGNNQQDYIFGKEVEESKKLLHDICFADTIEDIDLQYLLKFKKGNDRKLALKKVAKQRFDLESLERLQSLERLERLGKIPLTLSNLSYENVKIEHENPILYCDIPYRTKASKKAYINEEFNHAKFYNWTLENENTVIFSEYLENVPAGFEVIWKKEKPNLICATQNSKKSIEVLAWNKK